MSSDRILVVDDDSSLRSVMKMQLEEAGYQVALASDGKFQYIRYSLVYISPPSSSATRVGLAMTFSP